jgi:DNA-binding transcriptional ArsR family regulator
MNSTMHRGESTNPGIPKIQRVDAAPSVKAFAQAAQRLDAISDPVRLRILWWLGQGEWSVTDLCGLVAMRQQAVTHHLNIAKLRRMVESRRQGRFTFYRLTDTGQEAINVASKLIR